MGRILTVPERPQPSGGCARCRPGWAPNQDLQDSMEFVLPPNLPPSRSQGLPLRAFKTQRAMSATHPTEKGLRLLASWYQQASSK